MSDFQGYTLSALLFLVIVAAIGGVLVFTWILAERLTDWCIRLGRNWGQRRRFQVANVGVHGQGRRRDRRAAARAARRSVT